MTDTKSTDGTEYETYAILMLGNIPERLFPDMETAEEYVDNHDRLTVDDVSIWWPIRKHKAGVGHDD